MTKSKFIPNPNLFLDVHVFCGIRKFPSNGKGSFQPKLYFGEFINIQSIIANIWDI